jgi:hypothetical protein
MQKMNYRYYCHFFGVGIYTAIWTSTGSSFLNEEQLSEFSQYPTAWKIILKSTTGNVVITEVDVLMYVVLSMAEKHVTYEELIGTTKAQC